jgi:hypothetical protein
MLVTRSERGVTSSNEMDVGNNEVLANRTVYADGSDAVVIQPVCIADPSGQSGVGLSGFGWPCCSWPAMSLRGWVHAAPAVPEIETTSAISAKTAVRRNLFIPSDYTARQASAL